MCLLDTHLVDCQAIWVQQLLVLQNIGVVGVILSPLVLCVDVELVHDVQHNQNA